MRIDLSQQVALVTSGTAGIGLAIAQGLLEAGAKVVITGRTAATVEQAVAQLQQAVATADVLGLVENAATKAGCDAIVAAVPVVDILINNLGIYGACEYADISDNVWFEFFETNVMSGVRLSRHYAQVMKDRGYGRIQFISSESAVNIPADMVHYGVSKAALQGLSRGLAKALAGTNVTVNTVLPGPTKTAGAISMMQTIADEQGLDLAQAETHFIERHRNSSILRRFAQPQEVANMCVYLASPQASATTGAAVRVEGGIVDTIV